MSVERCLRGGDQRRVIGEAQIIVRAHVKDLAAAGNADVRVLRGGDDAFGFVETLRPDLSERVGELLVKFREHEVSLTKEEEDGQS